MNGIDEEDWNRKVAEEGRRRKFGNEREEGRGGSKEEKFS